MTPRVLVTGGAGYIGSHACKALASAGFLPVAFDDLSRGHASAVKWGPLVHGSLLDAEALADVVAVHRPVAVLHFAGLAYVGESVEDPLAYYRTNVCGSMVLVDAVRAHGGPPIVFSSSCAVYGVSAAGVIDEQHPRAPINPYGRSKNMVECLLRDCEPAYGLRSVCLRYFNCAGADPEGELGEDHDPEPHIIPRILAAAAGETGAFDIYGGDYPTPDGTAVRDYVHVSDLAAAHVAALRYLLDGGDSLALNLGIGRGYSVREVVGAGERVTGRRIRTQVRDRRPGDPPILVASPGLARAVLGWQARYDDLDDMIATAWAWRCRRSADARRAPAADRTSSNVA
ncbi:MAG: UDP-glucose 4-epimerase GalE [Rhodospirillales bacterium]|nr:UDP-glucose 4-epimerase GalE [Rhodospirillales bacterium]